MSGRSPSLPTDRELNNEEKVEIICCWKEKDLCECMNHLSDCVDACYYI